MSNEYLQKDLRSSGFSDTYLERKNSPEVQALLLGAYLDDKKDWEDTVRNVADNISAKLKEITELNISIMTQTGFKRFVLKTFSVKTKQEKKLNQLNKELDKLKTEFLVVSGSPPKPDAYELAMMGSLFKSR